MTTDVRFDRPLTDDEMDQILEHVAQCSTGSEAVTVALIETFNLMLESIGSSWEGETSIDGKQFRIPKEQWIDIANAIQQVCPEDGVQACLVWMNKGPSGGG